jgi:hypothetical protein
VAQNPIAARSACRIQLSAFLSFIVIEKGKKIAPDARIQKLLADGVAIANAASYAIVWYPRTDMNMAGAWIYPDTDSVWITAFLDKNVFFNGKDDQTGYIMYSFRR